ncbi:MAG: hypothetical protein IFK94_09765 [Acidobacteria bacterium]|uniref:DUF4384 domain-containing protein n=1 Tax=Candidatus Polarisedimenticola svalbardensis TaxID=2886004 RepID=A0A8J7CEL2_9BACT|nr:hypothetical protein [Candidatus Polarisedimenticola svalbardensis]
MILRAALCGLVVVLVTALGAVAAPPALPETPLAPFELLYARPFTLAEPMEYLWSKERPMVTSGWLLVLEVDPAVAYPRQTALPVLYAGDQVAHYAMKGYPSGRIVAVVPARIDLQSAPIWFGTPTLPEQVDQAIIQAEEVLAREAGIGPFPSGVVEAALAAGGPELVLNSSLDLEALGRELHVRYLEPAALK